MIKYNEEVIKKYARKLYRRAIGSIIYCIVVAGCIGLFGGSLLEDEADGAALIGAGAGAFIGLMIGLEISLWIRFKAQMALCMAKIEENTRK